MDKQIFNEKLSILQSGLNNFGNLDKSKIFSKEINEKRNHPTEKKLLSLAEFSSAIEHSKNLLKESNNTNTPIKINNQIQSNLHLNNFLHQKRITDYNDKTKDKIDSKLFINRNQINKKLHHDNPFNKNIKDIEFNKDLKALKEIKEIKQTIIDSQNDKIGYKKPLDMIEIKKRLLNEKNMTSNILNNNRNVIKKQLINNTTSPEKNINQNEDNKKEKGKKIDLFEDIFNIKKQSETIIEDKKKEDSQSFSKMLNNQIKNQNNDDIFKTQIDDNYPYDNSNNRTYEESMKWDYFNCNKSDILLNLLCNDFYTMTSNEKKEKIYLPINFYSTNEYIGKWVSNFYNEAKNIILSNIKMKNNIEKEKEKFIKEEILFKLTFNSKINDSLSKYNYSTNKKQHDNSCTLKDNDMIILFDGTKNEIDIKDLSKKDIIIGINKNDRINSHDNKKHNVIYIYEDTYNISYKTRLNENTNYKVYFLLSITSLYREFLSLINFQMLNQSLMNYIRKPPRQIKLPIESMSNEYKDNTFKIINIISKNRKFNKSQISAIVNSLSMSKDSFLLIQGPPGTGKTHTICGIINSIFIKNPNSNILICTPSNAAIDEVLKRIITDKFINNDSILYLPKLLRFGANEKLKETTQQERNYKLSTKLREYSFEFLLEREMNNNNPEESKDKIERLRKEIDKVNNLLNSDKNLSLTERNELNKKRTCLINEQKDLLLVKQSESYENFIQKKRQFEMKLIKEAKIIFTTLNSSGNEKLLVLNKKYNYLIIDEACQTTEPSCLIPMNNHVNRIIMVGDHKQLPATIFSEESIINNYNKSLFERFIENNHPKVFLDTQYRMNKSICDIVSTSFYDSQLLIDDDTIKRINENFIYKCLLKSTSSFSFFNIKGNENKMGKSYINTKEVLNISNFIQEIDKILTNKKQIIRHEEVYYPTIGIISPYKEQVNLINSQLDSFKLNNSFLDGVHSETVDSFQGQERDIIIISTVRSKSLGFLVDERRLNVAISRARYGCFIFGDLNILKSDVNWKRIIKFCEDKGNLYNIDALNDNKERQSPFRNVLIYDY